MNNNSQFPSVVHVGTQLQGSKKDPSAPPEGMAVFVTRPVRRDETQEAFFAKKELLITLLPLIKLCEMQGYQMPVDSLSFTQALGSVLAMEATLGPPEQNQAIVDLVRPTNLMTRKNLEV